MTQSRIAEQLGISQMHVSRLLNGCCAKVRDEALAEAVAAAEGGGDESTARHGTSRAGRLSGELTAEPSRERFASELPPLELTSAR
jgi:transcriptional regulator with XRE-family HTH domain